MANLDLDALVFSAPSFPWWFGISMCALSSNPWSEKLRRIEVGLEISDYLSRGDGGRLVDCEHAFDDLASVLRHYAVEEEGGTAHGNSVERTATNDYPLRILRRKEVKAACEAGRCQPLQGQNACCEIRLMPREMMSITDIYHLS